MSLIGEILNDFVSYSYSYRCWRYSEFKLHWIYVKLLQRIFPPLRSSHYKVWVRPFYIKTLYIFSLLLPGLYPNISYLFQGQQLANWTPKLIEIWKKPIYQIDFHLQTNLNPFLNREAASQSAHHNTYMKANLRKRSK